MKKHCLGKGPSIVACGLLLASALSAQDRPPLVLSQAIPLPEVKGGFNHHDADGNGHRVFLCATTHRTVEILDLDAGKIVRSIPGETKPAAVCYAADLGILCVSRGRSIELYNGRSFGLIATILMPASVDEMHYDPVVKRLFAGSMNPPSTGIARIDLVQRKLIDLMALPKPQGFALEGGGNRIFACTPETSQVSIADRTTGAALPPWRLSGAQGDYSVAYDSATHRLFVGCRRPPKLLVFNTDTGGVVATVDIGTDTDDLSFDSAHRRVYVACGQGEISVIQQDDADHYRKLPPVASRPGGRNCVFVPETGAFCVTVPPSGDQPAALLVYRAQSER